MNEQNEIIKAGATLACLLRATHCALLQFRSLKAVKEKDKLRLKNTALGIENAAKILDGKDLGIEDRKKLKEQLYGGSAGVYEILELVSLLPDNRIDEFLKIMEHQVAPIRQSLAEAIKASK